MMHRYLFLTVIISSFLSAALAQESVRKEILLNEEWATVAHNDSSAYNGFEKTIFNVANWKRVDVPHNWDAYEGYRRLKHGNRHGYAWYRKTFSLKALPGKRYFLWFEGVGSYATVWLNGKKVGDHAGGRTTFTIDITDAINLGNEKNILAVRADHPPSIRDLPWVCGGCSDEVGFSEGSQPMGIFRPVHLIVTNAVRIEPFGVHVWNDTTVSKKSAVLNIETEIKNYSNDAQSVTLVNTLVDRDGRNIVEIKASRTILPHSTITIKQATPVIENPNLWSLEDPYCYKITAQVIEKNKVVDQESIDYGIRWIRWPTPGKPSTNQFFLNDKPVFINGTAEYEHMLGQSHAFTNEEIHARVMQIKAAGFNAFRDAHQPHNLRYQNYWDQQGILWWTQMAAHIWFDTPAFRNNFKVLLRDWVKERRNSPSLILWGLENESHLPGDFAKECTELIRSLDPTTSSQRKVTTCNGGTGTDWDVPQNWTGTYGGDPLTYAQDIKKQILIGEYGAWRSLDLHTEGPFLQKGVTSEDRMTQLMETKIRLAESIKDSCSGQFHWLFTSHENPGRVQSGEGFREMDRVGPVNYKGLLSPWGEPLDAFYMFRSNYAPKQKEPMVYIVSHTWPNRWSIPGKKDSIIVYSNCDEVELFNDVNSNSLGKKINRGIGTHFQWDDVMINYNMLYAVGYVNGKAVARDYIVLHHLPKAPNINDLVGENLDPTLPGKKMKYLYRVNCGGPNYTDIHGNTWSADRHKDNDNVCGSTSWTDEFTGMPSFFASQRKTNDPIKGTKDSPLFQTFRYGRDKLKYQFPVQDGDYVVELYFTEPWYGTGGGMNCSGWRVFDVSINDQVVLNNLDIWKEVGHDVALKKTVRVHISGGMLNIAFPKVLAGQAVISAIAIATTNTKAISTETSSSLIKNLTIKEPTMNAWSIQSWLETGDQQYTGDSSTFFKLVPSLYGAEWIKSPVAIHTKRVDQLAEFTITKDADVYVAFDAALTTIPSWLLHYDDTKTFIESDFKGGYRYKLFRKRMPAHSHIYLGGNGDSLKEAARMYSVFVKPVNDMAPTIDLRKTRTYKSINARAFGAGIVKDSVNNKSCVTLTAPGDRIEWDISFGVADYYALRLRYANTSEKAVSGIMSLLASDGKVMKRESLEFGLSKLGKWKVTETTTNTMINAGNYKVVVEIDRKTTVSFRELEVQ